MNSAAAATVAQTADRQNLLIPVHKSSVVASILSPPTHWFPIGTMDDNVPVETLPPHDRASTTWSRRCLKNNHLSRNCDASKPNQRRDVPTGHLAGEFQSFVV
jgi:hypothetical protein